MTGGGKQLPVSRKERARARRVMVIAAVIVMATPVMLASAILTDEPAYPPPPPSQIVLELDGHAKAGRWAQADALMDYRAKGAAMLPDLWAAAPEADREALVGFLKPMFRTTWEQAHAHPAFVAGTTLTTLMLRPDLALVEQAGEAPGGRPFALLYWIQRTGDRWRVVDRTKRVDHVHMEPGGIVASIRAQIHGQLGREPNLREFAANAPSWIGRVRSRTFPVGDLLEKD